MRIAVPKEILDSENRVAATPETVIKYRELGHQVAVESHAGEGIFISDEDYRKAGAEIVSDVEELMGKADLILKVKQPIFNTAKNKHEVEMMRLGCTLVTFLHPAAPHSHDMVKMLRDRNILSFTMDGIPRISRAQRMDALTSMSTVTGYRSVLDGAIRFSKFVPMIGTAIGTIKPATVLVVGAGVVGLQAVATAKRLGAIVRVWDIREAARKEAGSLGAKVEGFEVPPEIALAEGGYAKTLSAEWIKKEQEAIKPVVAGADIIILSALVPGSLAPIVITKEAVAGMQPGSVIVDVSIDQGGNCELTKAGEEFRTANGVLVTGVANIPGRMAVHATWLYAQNMYYYIENLYQDGRSAINYKDEIVSASLVTKDKQIVFKPLLDVLDK